LIFEMKAGSRGLTVTSGKTTFAAALPCTLLSDNQYGFIELGDTAYRGSLVFFAGRPGTINVVNHLGIEEYLRGVVPLEMGNRTREEIEALKAQAVAARTYTCRRIAECTQEPYDLVPTVADQVYGGASAENREADLAVASTANLIMVSGDTLVMAYYHSTCGGITADVNEAWGKPARTYLSSIVDVDDAGRPWCRASSYFTWDESWSRRQFSAIVLEALRKTFPQRQFTGTVDNLTIDERYKCGRIRRATVSGNGWEQQVGSDQIRFVLRRGVAGSPILRSSNFTLITSDRNVVSISGKGYGHGVGMCQMGAIGRAQAGQNFVTILKSYYTGVSIARATVEARRQ
jgi:stage II sporulation protein D